MYNTVHAASITTEKTAFKELAISKCAKATDLAHSPSNRQKLEQLMPFCTARIPLIISDKTEYRIFIVYE